MYKLARKGIEVEQEPREVTIHELRLLRLEGEELECEMRCTKGTYVRRWPLIWVRRWAAGHILPAACGRTL